MAYRFRLPVALGFIVYLLGGVWNAPAASGRVANTTLQLPQRLPTSTFTKEPAFPNLTFRTAVALVTPPGETNRLFVVEQNGIIWVISNLANPTKSHFLTLSPDGASGEGGVLGLAFHPGYRTNRYFFVFYTKTTTTAAGTGSHDRLSRFEINPSNTNAALIASERPLISQFDESYDHNGGDLHFGPDGYLYVSLGDEGCCGDPFNNTQRIDKDFFSGFLRIDVDKRPGSLEPNPHPAIHTDGQGNAYYSIPPDNPFVGASSFNGQAITPNTVRSELWAVGLRNPWRFSFDPANGRLYCGDVGEVLYEEVDIIVKGGNYGWNHREGLHPYSGTPPPGVTFVDPIVEYPHNSGPAIPGGLAQGRSVTGGVVYRGTRYAELMGHYVFGDFSTHALYALQYDGQDVTDFRKIGGVNNPVAFGTDPRNGDVLIGTFGIETLFRVVST